MNWLSVSPFVVAIGRACHSTTRTGQDGLALHDAVDGFDSIRVRTFARITAPPPGGLLLRPHSQS